MSDVDYTPFKCPDCKTWWRTATHKCEVAVYSPPPSVTTTTSGAEIKVSKLPSYKRSCKVCDRALLDNEFYTCKKHAGQYGWNEYNKKKEHPHGPENPSSKWNT